MKHVYIAGMKNGHSWIDPHTGFEYYVKAVNNGDEFDFFISKGFSATLREAMEKADVDVEEVDEKAELREAIKVLGGNPSNRASVETLRAQLEALNDADNNQG